jgi:hypothetical protein
MKSIRLISSDLHSWITSINPNCTDQEIKDYFMGQTFNISTPRDEAAGREVLKTVTKIEILNDNNETVKRIFSH